MPPISKILVVVIESIRFLKCVHSLFEYCRPYGILASESVNTASENLNYLNNTPTRKETTYMFSELFLGSE